MSLLPLPLSALAIDHGSAAVARAAPDPALAGLPCAFCGVRSGPWQMTTEADEAGHKAGKTSRVPCCPLCCVATNLRRPRINAEAVLVWLPEMSQQVVVTVMRDIHVGLRRLGEPLAADAPPERDTAELRMLYHARAALAERAELAETRLGTSAPADLASALLRLPPASYRRRSLLLGGIRLLPRGQFFQGDRDVYPEIVSTWIDLAKPAGQRDARPGTSRLSRS